MQAAILSFIFLGSSFNDETLAANQILIQFLHISSYGMDGFAIASEALVGKAVGARKINTFRRAVKLTSIWGAITVIGIFIFFSLFGEILIRYMTTSIDIQNVAIKYLPWMVIAPLVGGASWMLDGIFIGASQTKELRNAMIFSVFSYLLISLYLTKIMGNTGIWISLCLFMVLRALSLFYYLDKIYLRFGTIK